MSDQTKPTKRGGKRAGAGRKPPPEPRRPRSFRVTDAEARAIRDLLVRIRAASPWLASDTATSKPRICT